MKKAAENRKPIDTKTKKKKKVVLSVVEAFGGPQTDENATIPVRDVEDVLRLEYRSKLLNPKWRDAMISQGSYEVSQRMTAMVGWAAMSKVDNFVFDQAAERYALDDEVAKQLQKSNPEAFKNVVRRLLEAHGRNMWEADEEVIDKLRELYSDADGTFCMKLFYFFLTVIIFHVMTGITRSKPTTTLYISYPIQT